MRDPSFLGLNGTQFLGAFNDNLFKQMVLLIAVGMAKENSSQNMQGVATFLFGLPFVLFSGVSGVLADRNSKRTIIVQSKVLEIVAMALGAAAFWMQSFPAMLGVLFLMGAQSAYFGPAKYGILPELFRSQDLPRANGSILMMTFLSIILGVSLAGFLLDDRLNNLWMGSLLCVLLAMAGTAISLMIRATPVAQPGLKITWSSLAIPGPMRRELSQNRSLLVVLLATSVFWCVGGIYQQGVNDLGELQLGLKTSQTSLLQAAAAIGIGVGCVVAGRLSEGRFEARLVKGGLWGMLVCLVLLAMPGPLRGNTLLGVYGGGVVLMVLGFCAGCFAVPIQVYLQAKSPTDQKGQVIGTMNLMNWIGIMLAGVIHFGTSRTLAALHLSPNLIFLVGAVLLLGVGLCFHPRSETLPADSADDELVPAPQPLV